MTIISKLMGNAVKSDPKFIHKKLQHILIEGEKIELSFELIRDMMILTDRRIILVDHQGLTGRKTEYRIVPYKSIVSFSLETASRTDLDFELKIWLKGGLSGAINKEFKKDRELAYEIIRVLSKYITE